MSLTSCFRYIIELPTSTLDGMIQAVLHEADAAGVQTSVHKENVPVGNFTATVDAQLADLNTTPPTLSLTAVDLGVVLHLRMNFQVHVNKIANLDPIEYQLSFDFAGQFKKQSAPPPPVLLITFPGLTPAGLNLVVSGGDIPLTPALIEPQVHALYLSHPELAHSVQTNVPTPLGTAAIIVDIYDDQPGSIPFRGSITVEVPDGTHIKLNLPGHLNAQTLSPPPLVDTDITVHVTVPVVTTDGAVTVALSAVTAGVISIDYTSPNVFTGVADSLIIRPQFATRIAALGDLVQNTPTHQQARGAISAQLVQYGSNLSIPMLRPTPPASPSDMDLTTFVPTTLQSQVLALQLEPQPVPCDTPDLFTGASQFAVSIDKEKCDATIQPVINAENGRTRNIQGHDVTIHDLSATLSNPGDHSVATGHIWIAGQATVHIDCWPDAHINFSGPITLTPNTQPDGSIRFQPHAGQFTADDPCCASVDPNQIGQLIESDDYPPIAGLPSNFAGVGRIQIDIQAVDIFAAGMVLRGNLTVITTHSLEGSVIQHNFYWHNEPPAGG